jgi:chemotaxis protein methyltransferase CheR
MTPQDYDFLCRFLKERSGLALAPEKEYLVDNRLLPVARRNGCKSVSELIQRLAVPATEALKIEVTEAMMNNESFFFRDRIPFDRMRDTVLPDLLIKRAHRKQIRIWCAAASTGQEPYSIAMLLAERADISDWRIEILTFPTTRWNAPDRGSTASSKCNAACRFNCSCSTSGRRASNGVSPRKSAIA